MLVTAWHGHSSVQPSCSGHSAALRLYRATSSKQGLYRDLDLGCSPPAEQPASLVNCPHCNTATANKSSPTIKAPVCLILQLRPKIGLERRGPPWPVIGFLIVCLAIGSTPCTRSATGPFAVLPSPPRQPMQFRAKYGLALQFCIQMGKK